jgi:predicted ferric reductase
MVAQIASKEIEQSAGDANPRQSAVGWVIAGVLVGVLAALALLPAWLPGLSTAVTGTQPKVFWYVSRSSALVAYVLLWASMASGLGISNKLGRLWPGAPTTFELHQLTSLLGLGFALVHALVLLGDHYIGYTLAQVLVPFASSGYRPEWVGLGQIALYGSALVGLTFYVRKHIGQRAWRAIHFLSFAVYTLALGHGILSGTDTGSIWASVMYWASGGILLFLTIYRVLAARYVTTAPVRR